MIGYHNPGGRYLGSPHGSRHVSSEGVVALSPDVMAARSRACARDAAGAADGVDERADASLVDPRGGGWLESEAAFLAHHRRVPFRHAVTRSLAPPLVPVAQAFAPPLDALDSTAAARWCAHLNDAAVRVAGGDGQTDARLREALHHLDRALRVNARVPTDVTPGETRERRARDAVLHTNAAHLHARLDHPRASLDHRAHAVRSLLDTDSWTPARVPGDPPRPVDALTATEIAPSFSSSSLDPDTIVSDLARAFADAGRDEEAALHWCRAMRLRSSRVRDGDDHRVADAMTRAGDAMRRCRDLRGRGAAYRRDAEEMRARIRTGDARDEGAMG